MVIKGLIGKKIGMTQIYKEGTAIPVTVIQAGPCYVLEIKSQQSHGYSSIKLGYETAKENRVTKPVKGMFKKLKLRPFKYIRELRIDDEGVLNKYFPGQELKVDIFDIGEYIDVTGNSKGKGFQGGVKRWGWHIGPRSHGSKSHRAIGSVGASSDPSRVWKGLHMAGHEGDETITVQNLEIVDIDVEHNLIVVKGAVPGARNSILMIRSAKKKPSQLVIPEPKQDLQQESTQEIEQTQGAQIETEENIQSEQKPTETNEKKGNESRETESQN